MPKHLTPDQLTALRSVPLGTMPNKVRIAIAMTGVQQTDIVDATTLLASQVSNAATGRGVISVEIAREISRFFGCSIEDLFPAGDDDGPEAQPALPMRRANDRREVVS